MIAKITAMAGKREDLIEVLTKSTSHTPGCFSNNAASHEASFSLPEVKSAISQAKSLVAAFERVAITSPVQEMGLGFHSGS
jgi:quinol monooxygenase YgiN